MVVFLHIVKMAFDAPLFPQSIKYTMCKKQQLWWPGASLTLTVLSFWSHFERGKYSTHLSAICSRDQTAFILQFYAGYFKVKLLFVWFHTFGKCDLIPEDKIRFVNELWLVEIQTIGQIEQDCKQILRFRDKCNNLWLEGLIFFWGGQSCVI